LDSEGQANNAQNGVFLRGSETMFLVSDNMKILPSSKVNSLMILVESGCSDLTQLEEVTHNIGKQQVINGFVLFLFDLDLRTIMPAIH
jgi:hypothetical protein